MLVRSLLWSFEKTKLRLPIKAEVRLFGLGLGGSKPNWLSISACCPDRKLQVWQADAPKQNPRNTRNIVWVVPRIRMVASHSQTFKALLDEWEARQQTLQLIKGQCRSGACESSFESAVYSWTTSVSWHIVICQDFTHAYPCKVSFNCCNSSIHRIYMYICFYGGCGRWRRLGNVDPSGRIMTFGIRRPTTLWAPSATNIF